MTNAELNNENKAKFFALYWGQKIKIAVRKDGEWELRVGEDVPGFNSSTITQYLELKPLSQITDEDSIEVVQMSGLIPYNDDFEVEVYSNSFGHQVVSWGESPRCKRVVRYDNMIPAEVDKARELGYAVPYNGRSVEQMVEAGWIKIIEK